MKVFVYGYRKEEAAYFSACAKAMQLEIDTCAQRPTLENAQLCQGYECISVLSTPIEDVYKRQHIRSWSRVRLPSPMRLVK